MGLLLPAFAWKPVSHEILYAFGADRTVAPDAAEKTWS
jgi:hypothetical protein